MIRLRRAAPAMGLLFVSPPAHMPSPVIEHKSEPSSSSQPQQRSPCHARQHHLAMPRCLPRAVAAHQHKQQLSAEGAARLVALEAAAAAQAGDMAASSKQLAKLSARVQVRGAAGVDGWGVGCHGGWKWVWIV